MNYIVGLLACVGAYAIISYAMFAVENDDDNTEPDDSDKAGA